MNEPPRRRDRTRAQLRAARRREATIYLPPAVGFRKSIEAFPGWKKLSEAGQEELAYRLWAAGCNAVFSGKLEMIEEADRKKLRAILNHKLVPLTKRYPIIFQRAELPTWLMVSRQKAKEPHTMLLHGIFTAYEETRQRYPDCGAPEVGLNTKFRKFLDAVLINFGLGPIGDKVVEGELSGPGMIGEGELSGAWKRWQGRT